MGWLGVLFTERPKLVPAQNKATIHPATTHPPHCFVPRICRIHPQPSATTCLDSRLPHTRPSGNRDDTTTSRKTSTSSSPASKAVALVSFSRIPVSAMNTASSPSVASSPRLSPHHSSLRPNAPLCAHLSANKQMVTTLR